MKKQRIYNFVFSALAIVVLWVAWIVAYYTVRNDYVVPSFQETFLEVGRLLGEGAFWRAFGGTVLRTLWAFLVSLVLGVGLALLSCFVRPVRAFLAPVVSVLRTVPTMALVLILLLLTRSPAVTPVIISALVLLPAFYAAVLTSMDEVKGEYGELARTFKISKGRQALKIYLPLAAPPVLGQTGATFSLGLKITVSGEVLSLTAKSIGSMMQWAQATLMSMPRLLALTLLVVLVGFAFEGLFALCYKLVVRWRA